MPRPELMGLNSDERQAISDSHAETFMRRVEQSRLIAEHILTQETGEHDSTPGPSNPMPINKLGRPDFVADI